MNVEQFATELKVAPALLVEQLQAAGVTVKETGDVLSDQDKSRLLDYLRGKHGAREGKSKITLTRKQTSEIKTADSSGRTRTVQVEVRKKRTLIKREV
ncbi:MAG: translation initiation factor IF-2, partial [Hydrogenophilales bacterium CG17_big_fil_post_rev_8_21_14_2_50_63_12]